MGLTTEAFEGLYSSKCYMANLFCILGFVDHMVSFLPLWATAATDNTKPMGMVTLQ